MTSDQDEQDQQWLDTLKEAEHVPAHEPPVSGPAGAGPAALTQPLALPPAEDEGLRRTPGPADIPAPLDAMDPLTGPHVIEFAGEPAWREVTREWAAKGGLSAETVMDTRDRHDVAVARALHPAAVVVYSRP